MVDGSIYACDCAQHCDDVASIACGLASMTDARAGFF
jgi:hypothetical protein